MSIAEADSIPYAPASRVVDLVRRAREGRLSDRLTTKALQRLGVPEGNADRVLKALQFLSIVDENGDKTPTAHRLQTASSEEYPGVLLDVLRGAYGSIFATVPDPAQASDIQIEDAFRFFSPAGQRKNMVALFRGLCREASINIAGPSASPSSARTARKAEPGESRAHQKKGTPEAVSPASRVSGADPVTRTNDPTEEALLHLVKTLPFGRAWTGKQRQYWITSMTNLVDYAITVTEEGDGEGDE